MEAAIEILNNYVGRDSVIRTCSYLSLFLSEYANENVARKLKILSNELSYCRLINRFFDDLPMLHFSLQYGMGSKDDNLLLRILFIFQNAVDQIYLPIEHMAWAADKRILKMDSYIFHALTVGLWALSSYLSIIRSLINISHMQKNKHVSSILNRNTSKLQFEELLFAFKSTADFIIAVNYLPQGTLMWAGTLSRKRIAFYGLISSILRVYLYYRNMKRCH